MISSCFARFPQLFLALVIEYKTHFCHFFCLLKTVFRTVHFPVKQFLSYFTLVLIPLLFLNIYLKLIHVIVHNFYLISFFDTFRNAFFHLYSTCLLCFTFYCWFFNMLCYKFLNHNLSLPWYKKQYSECSILRSEKNNSFGFYERFCGVN